MSKHTILFLCPLGQRHQQWRIDAAPADFELVMRRSTELARSEALALVADADVLITERTGIIDRELIAAGQRLKLIQRHGSLWHDIDLDAARAQGVPVCARPIRGVIAVAENVMLQMLALLRRAMPLQPVLRRAPETFGIGAAPHAPRRTSEDVFAFNWSGERRVELLQHKRVGILGFGEIGAELARRLRGWGCMLQYAKRQRLPEALERELQIQHGNAETLLETSDVLISLLPYSRETDLWLNADRIARMKPGALLVHAGSGSVIDEAAVAAAIRSGALGGTSFDTFEWEPLAQDNPLLNLADSDPDANIFLLPHIGSCNNAKTSELMEFYGNALAALRGEALEGRIA
jgi:phosphoglycerate dehydrogenase-like enzyme